MYISQNHKNSIFSALSEKIAPPVHKFEAILMSLATKFKGTLYGILVIVTFFTFSLCGFDAYYDILLIFELILTIIFGYLILLHDCENIYHYISWNYKAYHPKKSDISINELINQQVMKDSFPYKVLLIIFVLFLFLLFGMFMLANYKGMMQDPGRSSENFLLWLFYAFVDGFKENQHKATKLLHFGVGIAIMVFATHIISTLAFQRLTNLIEIINKTRETANFK